MSLNKLSKEVYQNAVNKGFYEKPIEIGTRLALIHSEVSEMLEADREGRVADITGYFEREKQIIDSYSDKSFDLTNEDFKTVFKARIKDTFEDELADVVIRCLDTAGYLGIDLDAHVSLKMKYNSLREHKHGKAY